MSLAALLPPPAAAAPIEMHVPFVFVFAQVLNDILACHKNNPKLSRTREKQKQTSTGKKNPFKYMVYCIYISYFPYLCRSQLICIQCEGTINFYRATGVNWKVLTFCRWCFSLFVKLRKSWKGEKERAVGSEGNSLALPAIL